MSGLIERDLLHQARSCSSTPKIRLRHRCLDLRQTTVFPQQEQNSGTWKKFAAIFAAIGRGLSDGNIGRGGYPYVSTKRTTSSRTFLVLGMP